MFLSLHSHFSEQDFTLNSSGENETACSEANAQSCHRISVLSLRKCLVHQSFPSKNLFPKSSVCLVSAGEQHQNPWHKLVGLGLILVKGTLDVLSVPQKWCHFYVVPGLNEQILKIKLLNIKLLKYWTVFLKEFHGLKILILKKFPY